MFCVHWNKIHLFGKFCVCLSIIWIDGISSDFKRIHFFTAVKWKENSVFLVVLLVNCYMFIFFACWAAYHRKAASFFMQSFTFYGLRKYSFPAWLFFHPNQASEEKEEINVYFDNESFSITNQEPKFLPSSFTQSNLTAQRKKSYLIFSVS